MYTKKQPIKTDQEWEKIRFRNNLGPQIGGLLHDAVALTIADFEKENAPGAISEVDVKQWLNTLYKIAEAKKTELTEIKPVSNEAAKKSGDEFNKRYKNDSKLEDINNELNKEADKREDEGQKWGADNLPTKAQ